MKNETIQLFHKCTLGGLLVLLNDSCDDLRLCCSSLESDKLFCRDYCIELDAPKSAILAKNDNDIDAHTQTDWDEIRINFKKEYVKKIIGSKRLKINDNDMTWCGNYGVIRANNDHDAKVQIRKLFNKLEVTPVRQSGYTKSFLNI